MIKLATIKYLSLYSFYVVASFYHFNMNLCPAAKSPFSYSSPTHGGTAASQSLCDEWENENGVAAGLIIK